MQTMSEMQDTLSDMREQLRAIEHQYCMDMEGIDDTSLFQTAVNEVRDHMLRASLALSKVKVQGEIDADDLGRVKNLLK